MVGETITIPITVGIPPGFCNQSDSVHSTIRLAVISCATSECLCPEGPGTVNLKGSNMLLSRKISAGFFGDPNAAFQMPVCLSINGSLLVDLSFFQLDDCEIILGPTSSITVQDNSTLHLKGNYIHGCDYLWHSIAKIGNGTLLLDDNIIQDAISAVRFENNGINPGFSQANITNNFFNKNHVGIFGWQTGQVHFASFYGNEFTCENETLLPPFNPNLSSPEPLSVTYAGIQLVFTESLVSLLGTVQKPNYFHHLQNGILSDLNTLHVSNARFAHIPVNDDHISFIPAVGIGNGIFQHGNLFQTGNGPNSSPPNFQSVRTGIHVARSYASVHILDNHMNEVKTGIRIRNSPTAWVNNNTIKCDDFGIDVFNNNGFQYLNVEDNTVTVDHPSFDGFNPYRGTGIKIDAPALNTIDNGNIFSNTVYLYERNQGIVVNLAEFGAVRENNVFLQSDKASSGIRLAGSQNVDLSCNDVSGASGTYVPGTNIGINVLSSRGCAYQCNNMLYTSVGLQFNGVCTASPASPSSMLTDVRGNTFSWHGYGLLMQPDALFGSFVNQGLQVHKGNTWLGGYLEDKAVHFGAPIQISRSKFQVHSNSLPYYPYSDNSNNPIKPHPPLPNSSGTTWFDIDSGGSPYECAEECYSELTNESESESINSFGLGLVKDSLVFTEEFDAAIKEALARQLYRILDDNPDLLNQDSALLNFYTNASNTAIATLTAIDRLREAISDVDSTSNVQITEWSEAIRIRLDSITVAEEELPTDPDSSTLVGFEQEREDYLLEIDSFVHLTEQLLCSLKAARLVLVDSALFLNSGIQPATDMEFNEVFTNRMYFSKAYFGDFDFSSTEQDTLLFIAEQCPTLGGNSVFNARGMLAAFGNELDINDDSLCFQTAARPVQQAVGATTIPEAGQLLVYPNPANDRLWVRLPDPSANKAEVRVFNAFAIPVFQQNMPVSDGLIEVPLAGLPPGLHVLRVFVEGMPVGVGKFLKSN